MTWSSANPVRPGLASPEALASLGLLELAGAFVEAGDAPAWMPAELPAPPSNPREAFGGPAVDPAMLDAMRRAAGEMEAARLAADAAEQVEADRRQALEDAYALGYADGVAAGQADERARLEATRVAAESALDQLRATESRWRDRMQENVCAVAVTIARELIGRELRGDAEGIGALVRLALTEFPIDLPVTIRVNPEDLATISAVGAAGGTVTPITGGREARWVADSTLLPAGCVVEGRDRIVDGRVDTALERMYRQLTQTHA